MQRHMRTGAHGRSPAHMPRRTVCPARPGWCGGPVHRDRLGAVLNWNSRSWGCGIRDVTDTRRRALKCYSRTRAWHAPPNTLGAPLGTTENESGRVAPLKRGWRRGARLQASACPSPPPWRTSPPDAIPRSVARKHVVMDPPSRSTVSGIDPTPCHSDMVCVTSEPPRSLWGGKGREGSSRAPPPPLVMRLERSGSRMRRETLVN